MRHWGQDIMYMGLILTMVTIVTTLDMTPTFE